jgi:sugar lactone lactonase YvrE
MASSSGVSLTLALLAASLFVATPGSAQNRTPLSQICDDCKFEKFASCGKFLEGGAFDKQGNLWISSRDTSQMMKVSPDGACSVAATLPGHPSGARLHKDGKLYITDKERGIVALDIATGQETILVNTYGRENLRGLNDLTIDKNGGIYVTEPYGSNVLRQNGRVFYLAPGKKELALIADTIGFPNGIVLSPDETRLYVAEYAQNRILVLPLGGPGNMNPAFTPYVLSQLVGGVGPDGMAVDAKGNVYAAHYRAGEIAIVDPDGFPIGNVRLPEGAGLQTTNLAFNDGWLYVTESAKNEVWRMKVKIPGHITPN